jgi:hypothetical protein
MSSLQIHTTQHVVIQNAMNAFMGILANVVVVVLYMQSMLL